MKNFVAIVLLTVLLAANPGVANAEIAPDWTLTGVDGEKTRLSHEVGEQTVILFFWATWCPYCKALMPHLQSIRHEYGDEIKILAIQIDNKGDAIAFMNEAGYEFTVLPRGSRVADLYEVFTTPGLMVIDENREIRFDLRDVPRLPAAQQKKGHQSRAALLAPYWAAILRSSIDPVVNEARQ